MPYTFFKYILNPTFFATNLVEVHENGRASLIFGFMALTETKVFNIFQYFSQPKVAVNKEFTISCEPFQLYSEKLEKFVEIPIPTSKIGLKPINCRLLSAKKLDGMVRFLAFLMSNFTFFVLKS